LPPLIAGCCLLIYWGNVVRKALRFRRTETHGVNLIPREPVGRWMRVVWLPTIVLWCVEPWLAVTKHFHQPRYQVVWITIGFAGAAVCLGATIATFACWHEMGRSWRIGIDPEEKTQLISSGAFRVVRHPIYTLSIFLVLGTLATTPTSPMLVIAVVHSVCVQIEARREENYLLAKHGAVYADYMKRVGRFLPRGAPLVVDVDKSASR